MNSFFSIITSLIIIWSSSVFPQVNANKVVITDPSENDVLQGEVSVTGNTDVVGFESYELAFMYENGSNDGDTFFIASSDTPMKDGVLGIWKTNEITDGDYRLVLTVNFVDDKPEVVTVGNLRVRNYTTVEEEETTVQETAIPESVVEAITATEPAESTQNVSLLGSMLRGMLYTVLAVVVLGLALFGYLQTRRRR